jgi:hypothetical protein
MICHVDFFKSKQKMKPNGAKAYAKPASTMFLFGAIKETRFGRWFLAFFQRRGLGSLAAGAEKTL